MFTVVTESATFASFASLQEAADYAKDRNKEQSEFDGTTPYSIVEN